jgi:hypothetical protein
MNALRTNSMSFLRRLNVECLESRKVLASDLAAAAGAGAKFKMTQSTPA